MKAVVFVKQSVRLPGKHLLEICGDPLVKRVYRILQETELFDEVVIYSKYREFELDGVTVERDESDGVLIDSIVSAIKKFNEFMAIGGDLPLLDRSVLRRVLTPYHSEPVAAVSFDGIIEPLLAVYNYSVYEKISLYARENKRIFPFLSDNFVFVRLTKRDSLKLFNINTMEDYKKSLSIIRCNDMESR